MRVREAQWAAQAPWQGIQDRPSWILLIPASGIRISDVDGLAQALAEIEDGGGGSVTWASITGRPTFGSAASADVSQFEQAPTDRTFQTGQIDFVALQRAYPVSFSPALNADPAIDLTFYISDGTSEEMFYGAIQDKDETGFTLWLNADPTVSRGWAVWRAKA